MDKKGSYHLRELIRILVRDLGLLEKSDAGCCGITISQCHAIVEIGRAKELSLNELADILTLDKSTMSRTINKLVEDKLVMRETHPEDRRYVTIELTEEGKKIFENTEESMAKYYESIFLAISEDKREQILDSLKMLVEAVHNNK